MVDELNADIDRLNASIISLGEDQRRDGRDMTDVCCADGGRMRWPEEIWRTKKRNDDDLEICDMKSENHINYKHWIIQEVYCTEMVLDWFQ